MTCTGKAELSSESALIALPVYPGKSLALEVLDPDVGSVPDVVEFAADTELRLTPSHDGVQPRGPEGAPATQEKHRL